MTAEADRSAECVAPAKPGARLTSVDALRGLVIVLMVLDHVRDFFHHTAFTADPLALDSGDPALFLTRWITHLCAPTFVFLAGVSIWLQQSGGKSRPALTRHLATRGLWLILLEFSLVGMGLNFGWWIFLQVIWAIGAGMVAASLLIWLPRKLVLGLAVLVLALHPMLQAIPIDVFGPAGPVWRAFAVPGPEQTSLGFMLVAYPAIPWIGLLLLGYAVGPIFRRDDASRRRAVAVLAIGLLTTFIVLRVINAPGFDPRPWTVQPSGLWTALSVIDVSKYPPSPAYVCLTLGLSMAIYLGLERVGPRRLSGLLAFGRTPLFTYLLHIWVAHGLALLIGIGLGYPPAAFLDLFTRPGRLADAGWGFGLPAVLGFWLLTLGLLYPLSKAFAGLKQRRRDWWLSYL